MFSLDHCKLGICEQIILFEKFYIGILKFDDSLISLRMASKIAVSFFNEF